GDGRELQVLRRGERGQQREQADGQQVAHGGGGIVEGRPATLTKPARRAARGGLRAAARSLTGRS
ncbi:hypothetical protein, partial [Salmonella enterica]|uniref:hypothetical protein n=1 Tax=Salmonella enterica TaxID=28901 RepID=UPI003FA71EDA